MNRPRTPAPLLTEYDYVGGGAGTAGCVLANRLTACGRFNVLLVEAGGEDDYFWIDIPVGYLYTIGNPRTDWCYRTEAEPGLNGRRIGYARGKVLGGCSSINAMIYMRGQASDYDHWAQLGNRGWSWEEVLAVFRRSEDYQHGANDYHGTGGELRVEERRVDWEILDAWRDAAAECGKPKIDEFNRGDNLGCAYFQVNQRRGRRWSGMCSRFPSMPSASPGTPSTPLPHRCAIYGRPAAAASASQATGSRMRPESPNYLATDEDRTVALAGFKYTRRIMRAEALRRFDPVEWKPGTEYATDDALLKAAGNLGTTIFHPVGTCRMGSDPKAVVSDRLKVHGIDGLRVIDASVMPTITSGNTNAPTVMIAEQGARFLLAEA